MNQVKREVHRSHYRLGLKVQEPMGNATLIFLERFMVPAFGPNRKTVNFEFPNKCSGWGNLNFTIEVTLNIS